MCRALILKVSVEMGGMESGGKSMGWLPDLNLSLPCTAFLVWARPRCFPSLSFHVVISMKRWCLTPRAAGRIGERIQLEHTALCLACSVLHCTENPRMWSWLTLQLQMAVFFVCRWKEAFRKDFIFNVWFAYIHIWCLKTEWHSHDVISQKCSPGVNYRL